MSRRECISDKIVLMYLSGGYDDIMWERWYYGRDVHYGGKAGRNQDIHPIDPCTGIYKAFFIKPERRHLVHTFIRFTDPVLSSLHRSF